ncbi:MAG: hypothetical protein WCR70_04125 [Sphaerochaetaceae bacterium]|jgi:hypothetical protein
MDYIDVRQASMNWGISERRIRYLCAAGRIEGSYQPGGYSWMIPASAQKPSDGRNLRKMKNLGLRPGIHDFSAVSKASGPPSEARIADAIISALAFGNKSLDKADVLRAMALEQSSLSLRDSLLVLNLKSALSLAVSRGDEAETRRINAEIMHHLGPSDYASQQARKEAESLYYRAIHEYSKLNPIVRSAFIFGELLRIKPFDKCNGETAYACLCCSLQSSGYGLIALKDVDEMLSALVVTRARGSYQAVIDLIMRALEDEAQ